MRISALKVESFKRVEKVEIRPGERSLVIVGGKNRQGKSSVLDAITAVFGGGRQAPVEPVKAGSKAAVIKVELDDGALTVERTITHKGRNTVEVRNADGKVKSPQKMLDALVGARFLDPLRFAVADAKTQRDLLLQCVDLGIDLDELAKERKRVFDERTDVGRDKKRLEGELAGIGDEPQEVELHDVGELHDQLTKYEDVRRAHVSLEQDLEDARADAAAVSEQIERLQAKLVEMVADGKQLAWKVVESAKSVPTDDQLTELRSSIAHAADHNKHASETNALRKRYLTVRQELDFESKQYGKYTMALNDLDNRKAAALAAATMPVDGLGFDDDSVTYDGVPFSQASGAQQLQVSLAIAAALTPELRDIWVKDGSLLDDESLEAIHGWACAHRYCVWLERVGDGDDDAIVIVDGEVRSE